MFNIGDIVLVLRGQKTRFFEIINVEGNTLWITDGWVQIRKTTTDIELICESTKRRDRKVPVHKYVK